MRPIVVVPAAAASRVGALLDAAGWLAAPGAGAGDGDAGLAVDVVRRGDAAIYVPEESTPADKLRRILVVHEGSRGDRAGIDAADEAAVASGAEIVVLHVPPSTAPTTSASLPFRMADHGTYDWAEWRDEFLRRFCRCSAGVRVTLRVSAGSATSLRDALRDDAPDLVVVSGPGEPGATGALEAVLEAAVPVLIVPSIGQERPARDRSAAV